jgi:two-component system sensor histidine kinase CreC
VSLRLRLVALLIGIFALGEWMVVRVVLAEVRPRYLESMEESLVDASRLLAAMLETQLRDGALDVASLRKADAAARREMFFAQIYSLQKTQIDLRVYVTDAAGRVVFDSDGGRAEGADYSKWRDVRLTLQGEYGARATEVEPGDPESLMLYIAAPIRHRGDIVGALSVGKPTRAIGGLVASAQRRLLYYAVGGGLGVLLVLLLTAHWVIVPIERLTEYARSVRDGRPAALPSLPGRTLRVLGNAFAEMRESLEGRQHLERTTQALAHGIKAPLAAVRGAAELLGEEMPLEERRRFVENLRAESGRIEQIVERLLRLTALEARGALQTRERIDLGRLADQTAETFRTPAEMAGVELRLECAPVVVCGDRQLLQEALANLIQNAVEFSPRGCAVVIGVHAEDGQACVTVADGGPGVPEYALPRVFERFYSLERPSSGRKSTGLGLSLVREIIHLHGGEVTLENRREGGALATLRLPVA